MTSQSTLTFQWTTWSIGVSVMAILVTLVVSWISLRRSNFRFSYCCLEVLRIVIMLIAVIILNQPEWIETFRPTDKPVLAILSDESGSMNTQDDVGGNASSTHATTRRAALAPLVDPKLWEPLNERFDIVFESIGSDAADAGTDLHSALDKTLQSHPRLRASVLISDGDWNSGLPPVDEALQYRNRDIPIYSIALGSESRLPDIELVSLDAPTFGIAGKSVRIPFSIESTLPREQVVSITLETNDGTSIERDVRIAAMGRTTDAIVWKPGAVGDYTLNLNVPVVAGELLSNNNSKTAPINIREEKLRVLVIESIPRWEYRYLRNALSRDPGVEVSCLLFHPSLSKVGGGNKDYLAAFPEGKDELAKYDVIFLGDVGTDTGQLTPEQCDLIKGLVENQASGLVFIPGWLGNQMSLLDTELEKLMPVTLDENQVGGWGSRTPGHFELTELGRRSLLTRLGDTQDQNASIWENLPGFQWYASVVRNKPGSEVLAVHATESNGQGRLPLLVTRTYGAGKVLFMGTDGAWRWRKGVEDLYHYRFWGQVVRWMAYQRNMAKGESMRLYYSPEQPLVRQTLTLNANVMEESGEPLSNGNVSARIVSPTGKVQTVKFASRGDAWGAFSGQFTPSEPGQHELTLRCQQTSAKLEASLYVQGVSLERIGKPARPQVLEEVSRVSQGEMIDRRNIDSALTTLSNLPSPPPEIRRRQLWSHPLLMFGWITLLGVFWVSRKIIGLI